VSFALIGLKLLGFGKLIGQWLSRRSLSELACIALVALLLVQTARIEGFGFWPLHMQGFKSALSDAQTALANEKRERKADRDAYRAAQQAAQLQNDRQIIRIKQQQQDITDATVSNLHSRLELIRSELRKNAAPQRPSGSAQAGDPGATPCRAYDPAWMCLSPEDRLSAAENEERHDELITWNLKQSQVDPNKP
jgi:Sec-independent protein translocase protein TatA